MFFSLNAIRENVGRNLKMLKANNKYNPNRIDRFKMINNEQTATVIHQYTWNKHIELLCIIMMSLHIEEHS